MKITDFLQDVGNPVCYYPSLAKLIGIKEAIFLCHVCFWSGKGQAGWIYRTADKLYEETGLSAKEQLRIRKDLKQYGLIEDKQGRNCFWVKPVLDRINTIWKSKVLLPAAIEELPEGVSRNDQREGQELPEGIPQRGVPLIGTVERQSKSKGRTDTPELIPPLEAEKQTLLKNWAEKGFPRIIEFGPKRETALRARLKEKCFRQNWPAALDRMAESNFITTEWKPTIDVFLRPGFIAQVLEGKYDDRDFHTRANQPPKLSPFTELKMLDERYDKHPANRNSSYNVPNPTPEQIEDFRKIKARRKELRETVAALQSAAA